jgi:cellulose synthase (UDP-forming)
MLVSLFTVISGKKVKFNVTPKSAQTNRNLKHVLPHFVLIILIVTGIIFNIILLNLGVHPTPSGFAANTFWSLFNIGSLSIMIRAAFWRPISVSD